MHKTQLDKLLGRNAPMRRKILSEYVQAPSGVADRVLAENLGIDHSNLRKHLRVLEEFGLVSECQTCNTRNQGRVGTPTEIYMMGHRLNSDIATLATIIEVIRYASRASLSDFLKSPFYRALLDELVGAVEDKLPPSRVWTKDGEVMDSTPDYFDFVPDLTKQVAEFEELGHLIKVCKVCMTPDEKNKLKYWLERDFLALEFVLHFLAANDNKRYRIISELDRKKQYEINYTPAIDWGDVLYTVWLNNSAHQNLFDCHVPSYLSD